MMAGKVQSSWPRRFIPGLTVLALTAVLNPLAAASAGLRLRSIDGGQDYYGRFSPSLPSDPNYFPIAVWFGSVLSQADVDLDKDTGLNFYVYLTANSDLSLVERNGMHAILQEFEWRNKPTAIDSQAVVGWGLYDEIDMTQGPGRGYTTLNGILSHLPGDHRMRYSNYGKGVMFWEPDGEAARFVNDFQDVVSDDIYWFTDPDVSGRFQGGKLLNSHLPLTPAQTRRAANYGYTVDRMRALAAARKPIWNIVEVCWPLSASAAQGGRTIQPAEVGAAVWHSIIAGARGIIYFNHSFGGPNPSQHCLREPAYAAARTAVRDTNRLITRLAPVLNAPSSDGFISTDPSVRTMVKFHDNKYYVFAGSTENQASTPVFSLSGFGDGVATVIDEDRTIPIMSGRFSDHFADGNAVHIYKIDDH